MGSRAYKEYGAPCIPQSDAWMWKWTRSGDFTVKNAYYVALKEKDGASVGSLNGRLCEECKMMWKAKVPPQIRNFTWRAIKQALLVGKNLIKRNVVMDPICRRYGEDVENVEHVLVKCKEAQKLWYLSPPRLVVNQDDKASFKEWVWDQMKTLQRCGVVEQFLVFVLDYMDS